MKLTRKEAFIIMLLAFVGTITLVVLLAQGLSYLYHSQDSRLNSYYYDNPARGR